MEGIPIGRDEKGGKGAEFRVAQPSRLLAEASRLGELLALGHLLRKVRFGGTPKPARETRALPRVAPLPLFPYLNIEQFKAQTVEVKVSML